MEWTREEDEVGDGDEATLPLLAPSAGGELVCRVGVRGEAVEKRETMEEVGVRVR